MKTIYLFLFGLLLSYSAQAQYASITITENGTPMAYHRVTISYGDYQLGSGTTDQNGFVSIYAPDLRSKAIDVEGFYQNGGTKREWSIKGKIKLDHNNSVHIRLEEMTEEMEASKREMEQKAQEMENRMQDKMKEMEDRMNQMSNKFDNDPDDIYGDDDDQKDRPGTNESPNFRAALDQIKSEFSSFKKKDIAMDLVKGQPLSTNQIKQILDEFSSSFHKKEIATAAYPKCIDKGNYESVISTLSSSIMQNELREATIGR
jgi:hypothetical protein